MGWLTGNAPATFCSTNRRSTFELQPPRSGDVAEKQDFLTFELQPPKTYLLYLILALDSSYPMCRMSKVFLERVDWRRADIKDTSLRMVSFYARAIPELGTSRWLAFAAKLIPVILEDEFLPSVTLEGDAFGLVFRPPRPSLIPHIRGEDVVWEEREPGFVFFDNTRMNLAPGFRTRLYRTNQAIAEEMADTYKVRVEKDPLSYFFPKDVYGRVGRDRAILLSNPRG